MLTLAVVIFQKGKLVKKFLKFFLIFYEKLCPNDSL